MESYWSSVLQSRVSRRRSLTLAGGAAAGAAFLAACGGGSSTSNESSSTSALPKAVDTTKQAKRGGNYSDRIANDNSWFTYDINVNSSGNDGIAGWVYSRFVMQKLGTRDAMPDGSVDGDFASSFEQSPDGMTVTFKVRPGIKWDPRPPTNGRVGDSEDLKFGYERFAARNPKRAALANQYDPDSPVLSVTTPDKSTAVMKLAFPFAPLMPSLSYSAAPLIMPPESERFDTRSTSRGTAAWISDAHEASNLVRLKRNPDWYIQDRPFLDTWTMTVIPDYAAGLAQFKAGRLDQFAVRQEDILITKKDQPSLVIGQRPNWFKGTGAWIFFGIKSGSPFRDERVRQAFSMSIDRDLWLETFSDKAKFEAEGLPVAYKYVTFLGPGYDYWLDPLKNELGDASKHFKFNAAEAKKLLTAAGVTQPIKTPWIVPDNNVAPGEEAIRGGVTSLGNFVLEPKQVLPYNAQFVPKVRDVSGDFEGVAWTNQADHVDPDHTLYNVFHTQQPTYYMGLLGEDKKISQLLVDQRRTLDRGKRADILKEFQRYTAQKMYMVPPPGDIKPFYLYQPWVMNYDYHVSWSPGFVNAMDSQTLLTYRWLDETKRKA